MPRRADYDPDAIAALFAKQSNVATHAQLVALNMPLSTVTHRITPRGPWQRILPGVVVCHRGTPTRRELVTAAVLYSGDGSVITGLEALRVRGVRAAQRSANDIHTLIPNRRRRASFGNVTVERCRRIPEPVTFDEMP